ncbi:hypothetical protein PCE1_002788 [Barthelona sp. PCE]
MHTINSLTQTLESLETNCRQTRHLLSNRRDESYDTLRMALLFTQIENSSDPVDFIERREEYFNIYTRIVRSRLWNTRSPIKNRSISFSKAPPLAMHSTETNAFDETEKSSTVHSTFTQQHRMVIPGGLGFQNMPLAKIYNFGFYMSFKDSVEPVTALQFANGEEHLLSGTTQGRVYVFSTINPKHTLVADMHSAPVLSFSILPGTDLVCSTGMDRKLILWDHSSLKTIAEFSFREQLIWHHLHPENPSLAICGTDTGRIRIINLSLGRVEKEIILDALATTSTLDHINQCLYVGCVNGDILKVIFGSPIKPSLKKVFLQNLSHSITHVETRVLKHKVPPFILATCSNSVYLLNTLGEVLICYTHQSQLYNAIFAPLLSVASDGSCIVCGADNPAKLLFLRFCFHNPSFMIFEVFHEVATDYVPLKLVFSFHERYLATASMCNEGSTKIFVRKTL